jgi:hypothetical protein
MDRSNFVTLRKVAVVSAFLSLTAFAPHLRAFDGPAVGLLSGKADKARTESLKPSSVAVPVPSAPAAPTPRHHLEKSLHRLPLTFTPNVGQLAEPSRFFAVGDAFALSLERSGVTFRTRVPNGVERAGTDGQSAPGAASAGLSSSSKASNVRWCAKDVHFAFIGANQEAQLDGLDAESAKFNYFIGNDPSKWKSNVPVYDRVRYANLYPGVDMVFYGKRDGGLEYDFVVAAGADPEQIRFRVSGDQKPLLDAQGNLQLDGKDGKFSLNRPVLYQDIGQSKKMISGAFVQIAENEFAFKVSGYDRARPLIIDPSISLVYSTYIGGRHGDEAYDMVIDASGNSYIAGRSQSQDFPVSGNAFRTVRDNVPGLTYDATVSKFSSSGVLLYSTFIGGQSPYTSESAANAISIDAQGNAYIAGTTTTIDFPTTANAYSKLGNGGFFAEFSPDGSTLLYSTNVDASIVGLALNAQGNVVLAGTAQAGAPTTQGSYMPTLTTGAGAFVAILNLKLPSAEQLVAATYYGTNSPALNNSNTGDSLVGFAIDPSGNIWIGGQAYTPNLPTTANAYQASLPAINQFCQGNGKPLNGAAFIAEFSSDLSMLNYATYFSGQTVADNIDDCNEFVNYLTFDSGGNLYAAGGTSSATFPVTPGALQGSNPSAFAGSNADYVGWVAKFAPNTPAPVWSTYFGGNGGNTFFSSSQHGSAIDTAGNLWISGNTSGGTNFPISANAYQSAMAGVSDGFVTEISPDGKQTPYSTYIGGSLYDGINAMAIDTSNNLYLAGATISTDFPVTADAFQSQYGQGCPSGCDGDDMFFTILGSGAIGVVGPPSGGNTGDTTITISGAGFATGATCELVLGGATITAVVATVNSTGTSITCTFELNGAAAGAYNVVVNDPDGTSLTKHDGFTVEKGGQPTVWSSILGRPELRTGYASTFNVTYGNSGNVDAYGIPVSIQLPPTFTLDIPAADAATVNPTDFYYTDSTTGVNYIQLVVPHLAAGQSVSFPFQVTDSTNGDSWVVGVTSGSAAFSSLASIRSGLSGLIPSTTCAPVEGGLQNCLDLGAQQFASTMLEAFTDMGTGEGFTFDSGEATTAFSQYYAAAIADLTNESLSGSADNQPRRTQAKDLGVHPDGFGISVNCCGSIGVTPTGGQQGPLTFTYNGPPSITSIPAIANNPIVKNVFTGPLVKDLINKIQDALGNQIFNSPRNFCTAIAKLGGATGTWTGNYDRKCGGCVLGLQTCFNSYQCNITQPNHEPTTILLIASVYEVNCNPNNPKKCSGKGKGKSVDRELDALLKYPLPLITGGGAGTGAGAGCGTGGAGSSIDPNYKAGPVGDGSASQYVRGAAALSYNVGFENEPTAALPAAQVVVTDQLDPTKVNLSSVTLGGISFGSNFINPPAGTTSYSTLYSLSSTLSVRVQGSLDANSGLLKWTFSSIDPTTGLPPTDPTVGFLPPDVDGIVGQGSVQFNVVPIAGHPTGTAITNMATVVFDTNAPIKTPAWLNTLDVTPPVSRITALPSIEPAIAGKAAFNVDWSGTDVGSGIATYTIYVSDDGGAFKPWQIATSLTSASYIGTAGHTYSFYSIATDNVGNVEAAKKTANAHTEVVDLKAIAKLSSSTEKAVLGSAVTLTAVVAGPSKSDPTPAGTVEFLSGSTLIGKKTLSGGKAQIVTKALPVGTHTITAVYQGDPYYPKDASAPVKVEVTKLTPKVNLSSSVNPSKSGKTVTFTAVATGTDGSPTGTVTFYVGSRAALVKALSGGKAIYSTDKLPVGTESIKAVYAGNAAYNGAISNAVAEKIGK